MKKVALMLLVSVICTAGFAQKKKKALVDEVAGQGYGMAGCGLGSIVFGDKPGMVQIFAATSNGIYGNQTFAITSGTSNCGESGRTAQVEQFINVNKVALEKEVVRGQGESLSSLSHLMGCQNLDFTTQMSKNYSRGFPNGKTSSSDLNKVALASCEL